MTNKPTFPLIIVDDSGYLALVREEDDLTIANVYTLTRKYYKKYRVYDKYGFI